MKQKKYNLTAENLFYIAVFLRTSGLGGSLSAEGLLLREEVSRVCSVPFSRSVVSDSLWPPWTAASQSSMSITNSQSLLKLMSELVTPSNHLILYRHLLLLIQYFPASGSFPMSQFFASGGPSIGVSASASVLPMNIQDSFPLGLTGWISLQARDSQESSPILQLKSINSLALSFLYGPTLTSIPDYWKNHSFDYMDLCQQSNVSAF